VSRAIAFAVGKMAQQQGVAVKTSADALQQAIDDNFWKPEYRSYRRTSMEPRAARKMAVARSLLGQPAHISRSNKRGHARRGQAGRSWHRVGDKVNGMGPLTLTLPPPAHPPPLHSFIH
jgi:hypothetical protein